MKPIRSINTRRVVTAIATPLKKKGVVIQPGSEAENAIKGGVRTANRGIRVLNAVIAEGETLFDEGRDAIHKATAPKTARKPR